MKTHHTMPTNTCLRHVTRDHFRASLLATAPFLLGLVTGCLNLDDPVIRLPEPIEAPEGEGTHCLSDLVKESDSLRFHFIDVGQGDAIWIETPDDGDYGNGEREAYNILVDTGEKENAIVLLDYLSRHGLPPGSRIDYLVITHAHADHYGGAELIMNNYLVMNILDPGFDDDSAWYYNSYLNRAEQELDETLGTFYRPLVGTLVDHELQTTSLFGTEIQTIVLNAEDQLRLGEERYNQVNNTSIALALTYQERTVLLMADVETPQESEIIAGLPDLRANILKVGHHGSLTSSSSAFLDHIFNGVSQTNRYAVVESGTRTYGDTSLPHPVVVNRLLEYVLSTNYYTTNNGDTASSPSDGAGDDHIQAVITGEGDIQICYIK